MLKYTFQISSPVFEIAKNAINKHLMKIQEIYYNGSENCYPQQPDNFINYVTIQINEELEKVKVLLVLQNGQFIKYFSPYNQNNLLLKCFQLIKSMFGEVSKQFSFVNELKKTPVENNRQPFKSIHQNNKIDNLLKLKQFNINSLDIQLMVQHNWARRKIQSILKMIARQNNIDWNPHATAVLKIYSHIKYIFQFKNEDNYSVKNFQWNNEKLQSETQIKSLIQHYYAQQYQNKIGKPLRQVKQVKQSVNNNNPIRREDKKTITKQNPSSQINVQIQKNNILAPQQQILIKEKLKPIENKDSTKHSPKQIQTFLLDLKKKYPQLNINFAIADNNLLVKDYDSEKLMGQIKVQGKSFEQISQFVEGMEKLRAEKTQKQKQQEIKLQLRRKQQQQQKSRIKQKQEERRRELEQKKILERKKMLEEQRIKQQERRKRLFDQQEKLRKLKEQQRKKQMQNLWQKSKQKKNKLIKQQINESNEQIKSETEKLVLLAQSKSKKKNKKQELPGPNKYKEEKQKKNNKKEKQSDKKQNLIPTIQITKQQNQRTQQKQNLEQKKNQLEKQKEQEQITKKKQQLQKKNIQQRRKQEEDQDRIRQQKKLSEQRQKLKKIQQLNKKQAQQKIKKKQEKQKKLSEEEEQKRRNKQEEERKKKEQKEKQRKKNQQEQQKKIERYNQQKKKKQEQNKQKQEEQNKRKQKQEEQRKRKQKQEEQNKRKQKQELQRKQKQQIKKKEQKEEQQRKRKKKKRYRITYFPQQTADHKLVQKFLQQIIQIANNDPNAIELTLTIFKNMHDRGGLDLFDSQINYKFAQLNNIYNNGGVALSVNLSPKSYLTSKVLRQHIQKKLKLFGQQPNFSKPVYFLATQYNILQKKIVVKDKEQFQILKKNLNLVE